jgi:hypothetical protein
MSDLADNISDGQGATASSVVQIAPPLLSPARAWSHRSISAICTYTFLLPPAHAKAGSRDSISEISDIDLVPVGPRSAATEPGFSNLPSFY